MKKIISWFEKKTILDWIGIILGFTIFLVIIVVLLNKILPNEFKFNKEVYGTVSDWFTFLATAIGIAFIIKTFESQRRVQDDQNIITNIELKRYRETTKPNLKLRFTLIKSVEINDFNIHYSVGIAPDKPCYFEATYESKVLVNGSRTIKGMMAPEPMGVSTTLIFTNKDPIFEEIIITIIYNDIDNVNYIKKLRKFYTIIDGKVKISDADILLDELYFKEKIEYYKNKMY